MPDRLVSPDNRVARILAIGAVVFVLLILVFAIVNRSDRDGPLENAGEKIEDAADDIGDAVEDAGDDIRRSTRP